MSHLSKQELHSDINWQAESSYSTKEELANKLSHAFGVVLSCLGMVFLLKKSLLPPEGLNIDSIHLVSFTLFGLSLIALYLSSTLYHSASQDEKRTRYKMWDHCAIYLLIAGTYTPYLLVTMRETVGWLLFFIIWGIAAFGILLKVRFKHRFKILRVATYLVMGWLVVLTLDDLKAALPSDGLNLLFAGGLVYTLGVFFYLNKRIPYNHAIWHLFVLGGSVCHFFSIYFYVMPI
jgi:hemolysin III